MAFKIALSSTYSAEVRIPVPQDNGLKVIEFTAQFSRLSRQETEGLLERVNKRELTDEQLVREVLKGWSGFKDDDGQAIEFNAEHVEQLLQINQAVLVLAKKFFNTVAEVREKN